ncbi:hypothetical protein K461DRAFT_21878 [Myriangium duriaei CBS 260.36]|uniref:CENP-V/GFA domain-containing protein n=1 Tax=Myriangium duriaei CBS 260.36 TaxID=1168546 RepID=A0A9P4MLR1_9PEZI|nr:hypothetical protein K461DRAFT_21878 [Myriangium duriaei CBS 260.36]
MADKLGPSSNSYLDKHASEKQKFTGSCTCGKVTYTLRLSLSPDPVFSKCNCTVCLKRGWNTLRCYSADFELVTPCTTSQLLESKHGQYVGNYIQPTSPHMNHYFCDVCGSPFMICGWFVESGDREEIFAVDPKTLDQPQGELDLSKFVGVYVNGLTGEFEDRRGDRPQPGGIM